MPFVSCSESHDHHLQAATIPTSINAVAGMAKTRSMSTRDAAPWSDLDHDVLFMILMKLLPFHFLAFSGVCKSWRSVALNNRTKFMASSLPMNLFWPDGAYNKARFLPHGRGRTCVGVTCGYYVLFGRKTKDFWLVNLIKKRKLHFPNVSFCVNSVSDRVRAILVRSPSLSAAPVLVMTNVSEREIWFSIAGKGAWNKVSSVNSLLDLHAFQGKIYTLNTDYDICELTLGPEPKLTIVVTKGFPIRGLKWEFVSSTDNLYMVHMVSESGYHILEVDIGEKKWVSCEKTISEYAIFLSHCKSAAAIKPPSSWPESWSGRCPQSGNVFLMLGKMWLFPHDSLDVVELKV